MGWLHAANTLYRAAAFDTMDGELASWGAQQSSACTSLLLGFIPMRGHRHLDDTSSAVLRAGPQRVHHLALA